MKHYNLKEIERCYVCGSIDKNINKFLSLVTSNLSKYKKEAHPKEKVHQEQQPMQVEEDANRPWRRSPRNTRVSLSKIDTKISKYNDSIIIVSGNCGIGLKDLGYYHEIFAKAEKYLADNNCYIFFIRGNNDNPSIFNECKLDYEHIKTIPDYSIVSLKNYNCLCIGGSTSIDKSWKVFQEKEFGKKMYWEDEKPTYQKDTLDEILKKFEIGCVISSSSPSFAYPGTNYYNGTKWFKNDKSLQKEFMQERKTLDKIYSTIIENDSKPYIWLYGRFGCYNTIKINDIVFCSLNKFQFNNVSDLIKSNFGINVEKDKLGKNAFSLDDAYSLQSADVSFSQAPRGIINWMDFDPPRAFNRRNNEEMAEEEVNGDTRENDTNGRYFTNAINAINYGVVNNTIVPIENTVNLDNPF